MKKIDMLNGYYICLKYKHNEDNSLFDTYEKALELVRKYPIVFTVLPEQFKDKTLVIEFLKANGKYLNRYYQIQQELDKLEKEKIKEEHYVSNKLLLDENLAEEINQIKRNAVVDKLVDLGELTKDSEVIAEAFQMDSLNTSVLTLGGFELNTNNFDEEALLKVVKKIPRAIFRLYVFWRENIEKYPKVIESDRVKLELLNFPRTDEIALLHCLRKIEGFSDEVYFYLLNAYACDNEKWINNDYLQTISDMLKTLQVSTQNAIVRLNHHFAKCVKISSLSENLQIEIAKTCPIAGDILPNKAVLQYNLTPSSSEDESLSKCLDCSRCVIQFTSLKGAI